MTQGILELDADVDFQSQEGRKGNQTGQDPRGQPGLSQQQWVRMMGYAAEATPSSSNPTPHRSTTPLSK